MQASRVCDVTVRGLRSTGQGGVCGVGMESSTYLLETVASGAALVARSVSGRAVPGAAARRGLA